MRRHDLLLTSLLLLAASAGAADFAEVCSELEAGRTIRLELGDGTLIEGAAAGWDGLRLALIDGDRVERFVEPDVRAVWTRERRTGGGAKLGAGIGAGAGAGFFTLLGLILSSMDDDGVSVPGFALFGGLLGGGSGALVGAVAGSAFSDWRLLYGDEDVAALRSPESDGSPSRRIGGLGGSLGMAWAPDQDDPGLSWRLGLTTRSRRGFEFELLFALHRLGPAPRRTIPPYPDPPRERFTSVWQAGVEARYPLSKGPVVPYPALGLAGYGWDDTFLGFSWGGGLAVDLSSALTGRLDYRRHDQIQHLTETDPVFDVISAGLTLAW